eukprot:CAMPEP_0176434248 /NCGR_PEP_ID=MMETSP0127-20121128/16557_1 /TAXON_ID=938130 /ORGANISM="Platyophrya macrostoma, Strain WH" /LENGTH=197 /DNA_ID=CAMNT_0017816935 /DNA_START=368 /DNA_END=960 /DNA_ORIENTATION=+
MCHGSRRRQTEGPDFEDHMPTAVLQGALAANFEGTPQTEETSVSLLFLREYGHDVECRGNSSFLLMVDHAHPVSSCPHPRSGVLLLEDPPSDDADDPQRRREKDSRLGTGWDVTGDADEEVSITAAAASTSAVKRGEPKAPPLAASEEDPPNPNSASSLSISRGGVATGSLALSSSVKIESSIALKEKSATPLADCV